MRLLMSFFLFFGLTSIVWAAPRPINTLEAQASQMSRRGILARAEEKKGTYENPLRFGVKFSTSVANMIPAYTMEAGVEEKQKIESIIKEVFQSPAVWTTLGVVEITSFEGNAVVGGLGQVVFDIIGDTNPTPCTHAIVWMGSKSFSITRMNGQPIHSK
ncbi:hypothetical protein EV368DRAFT_68850 [Lentinula lateritia]|nr:hypothetical protein EV368DRAFT_68850 [Lentinula lateritia]